jgi:hypothetical protein
MPCSLHSCTFGSRSTAPAVGLGVEVPSTQNSDEPLRCNACNALQCMQCCATLCNAGLLGRVKCCNGATLAAGRPFISLKGWNITAQGNALGMIVIGCRKP